MLANIICLIEIDLGGAYDLFYKQTLSEQLCLLTSIKKELLMDPSNNPLRLFWETLIEERQ